MLDIRANKNSHQVWSRASWSFCPPPGVKGLSRPRLRSTPHFIQKWVGSGLRLRQTPIWWAALPPLLLPCWPEIFCKVKLCLYSKENQQKFKFHVTFFKMQDVWSTDSGLWVMEGRELGASVGTANPDPDCPFQIISWCFWFVSWCSAQKKNVNLSCMERRIQDLIRWQFSFDPRGPEPVICSKFGLFPQKLPENNMIVKKSWDSLMCISPPLSFLSPPPLLSSVSSTPSLMRSSSLWSLLWRKKSFPSLSCCTILWLL